MRFVGIDPSTKTGVVILDADGIVLLAKEIELTTGITSTSKQLYNYAREIVREIPGDGVVCIEGFSFGSKGKGVSTQYGVGFGLRFRMDETFIPFREITPSQVKKFATGKGNTPKDGMVLPIYKLWGFEHESDNVRDAYVLAQIARAIRLGTASTKYQQEVIQAILEPPKSKKKTKAI